MLCVVNYSLPDTDYRLAHAAMTPWLDVEFALPKAPAVPHRFHRVEFGEGFRAGELVGFLRLFLLLRRAQPGYDFAHFFSTKLILLGPLLARAGGTTPVITLTGFGRTFSGNSPLHRLSQLLYRRLLRASLRCSSTVFCQNRGDVTTLSEWFPESRLKLAYVGSATDTQVRPPTDARDPARPLRVIHVARLLESKGINEFVKVAAALAEEEVDFTLVGPASASEARTERLVRAAADDGILRYLGPLPHEEVQRLYRRSDVILFPSHGEGMSRTMLEAAVNGLCPIAYEIPANIDLLPVGGGFLFPVGEVAGVVQLLRQLIEERELVDIHGRRFHDHVVREFSYQAYADRVDAVLKPLFLDGGDRGVS